MKKTLFFCLLFAGLFSFRGYAQTADSCGLRVSLLTCSPGTELYSSFGHSALRVTDLSNRSDVVFNYGTFDFDDPYFYKKFVKGQLLYFVSVYDMEDFLAEYRYFKRGVTEQVLQLSCADKQKLVAALYENAKEENKYYKYDFTYDNCTTRLRDMLEKTTGEELKTKSVIPAEGTTFRQLIHDYLKQSNEYWSGLGIDILLGSPLDKKISNREAMFLPDYLLKAFDSATLKGRPLVQEKREILPALALAGNNSFFKPFFVFACLFVLILLLSVLFRHNYGGLFRVFDFALFFLCGALGCLLLFMWFGTDHPMTKSNYNLLWALPTHLPVAFFLFTKKKWVSHYFFYLCFYSIALLAAWFVLPQSLNPALLWINGIIIVRSYFISKRFKA